MRVRIQNGMLSLSAWRFGCNLAQPRSLSELRRVGQKSTAAVHFSPPFCPIDGLWGCRYGKTVFAEADFRYRHPKSERLQANRRPFWAEPFRAVVWRTHAPNAGRVANSGQPFIPALDFAPSVSSRKNRAAHGAGFAEGH